MRIPGRPRSRRSRRGQALVEFALVAPLLLALIFGIVDFARAWNTYQVITDAAREAARTAVIDDPTVVEQDVRDVITAALTRASLDPSNATVTIDGFGGDRGEPTTVRIEYAYTLSWVGTFVATALRNQGLTLVSEIVMRNE